MVVVAPLLVGLMRQVRARLEGRVGAGILQPWRDLRKLLAQGAAQAAGTSWVHALGPVVLVASSLLLCALVPLVGDRRASPLVPDDLFVVVSVLLVGTVALALVGLDAGTAFGGMGSSRHMTIAALVEPTVLVAVYALSVPVGSSALSQIVDGAPRRPGQRRRRRSACSPSSRWRSPSSPRPAACRSTTRDPPRADDGPRGDGPGELGPRPRPGRAGLVAAAGRAARPASATCSSLGGRPRRHRRCLLVRRRHARRQARRAGRRCSPPSRCSSPSCGCSGFPSCWPAPSCSPSSP